MLMKEQIAEAEQKLAAAGMQLGLNPQSAGVSAFLNALLLSVRVDALIEYVQPFELDAQGAPIMKGTWEELHLKHLLLACNKLEAAVAKPRIMSANGAVLNG
jgi:hypothetical protein